MKNVHIYDILTEDGQGLQDLIVPMETDDFTYVDIFDKVQSAYFDNVDSCSYSIIE